MTKYHDILKNQVLQLKLTCHVNKIWGDGKFVHVRFYADDASFLIHLLSPGWFVHSLKGVN